MAGLFSVLKWVLVKINEFFLMKKALNFPLRYNYYILIFYIKIK